MSHESALEDVTPLHIGNIRAIPSTDARIKLMNLPKEQSQLNGLSATVLSQAAAKSSSGAIKLLVKLDIDGKRVSIPESMCQKLLDKLLVVNNTPMDIYIAPRDPQNKELTEAVIELGGKCVQTMSPTSVMIASPQAVALAQPSGFAVVSSTWLVRLVRSGVYVAPTEYRVDVPPAPKTPLAAAKAEPKTPAKQAAAPAPAPAPAPAAAAGAAAAPAPAPAAAAAAPVPSTPAAAAPSSSAPGVTPMKHADLMTAAQRKGCLQAMNEPAHREPFSKLEIRAQVSFVFDNPTLPLQSRKTWEQFRKETGSKRAADSLKSVCNSIAFLSHIESVRNPSGQSALLQKLGVTPAKPSTPAKFAQEAAAAPADAAAAAVAAAASPSRVIIQDSQLPQPTPVRSAGKASAAPTSAEAAPASAQKRARSPAPPPAPPPAAPAPAPAVPAAPAPAPAPAAPAPVAGFPPPSSAPAPAPAPVAEGDMAHVHKRMRSAAVEQVVRDLAVQSSCSIAVVTHALIVSSGDVALARRYLTNNEKVVDEMLLMTYEQDKWLIQHGKQQQQAALDGAPVALVSDADAIKLQNIGRRVVNGRSLWLNDGK